MDIAVHFVSLLWDMLRQAHRLGHGAAAVATLAERRKSSLEALVNRDFLPSVLTSSMKSFGSC